MKAEIIAEVAEEDCSEVQREIVQTADGFSLPSEICALPETQETYCQNFKAYPLRGRPFGLALVWGNSYQDDRGNVTLMVAADSANMIAEVLQQTGFEVRVRLNMRKKYVLDELAEDNIGDELREKYDMLLIYFSGRGDGDGFMTQYGETVTVKEIWERMDSVGMKNKPRVMIMDLFDIRSTFQEQSAEEASLLAHQVAGAREDVNIMVSKQVNVPQPLLDNLQVQEEQLKIKQAQVASLRRAPAAGMQARIAVLGVPITDGVIQWTLSIKQLTYSIAFGVCQADELNKRFGQGLLEYTGICDFLGSDQYSWAFNQTGRSFHNEYEKAGKQQWGKVSNIVQGDQVIMTYDASQGVMRMEVPGKFKGATTKLMHPLLVKPVERGVKLTPAIALYCSGDSVEIESLLIGTADAGPSADMKSYTGRIAWDKRQSAPGLAIDGRLVSRGEGLNLPKDPDTCIILSRQPCIRTHRMLNERGDPVGEMYPSIYDVEPEHTEGMSLFSYLFAQRLKNSVSESGSVCFLRGAYEGILEEMQKYALHTWLKTQSGLQGRTLENVVLSLRHMGVTVDSIKHVTDKSQLDEYGVRNRTVLDTIFKAVMQARNDSCMKVQALTVVQHCTFPKDKRLLFSIPPLAWSMRHKSINVKCHQDAVSKEGQSIVSCLALCSLESELRSPRHYGALLPGGGKHSWTWVMDKLRSSQAEDEGDERHAGVVRLGLVQTQAVRAGRYSIAHGRCRGGTTTTVVLDKHTSSTVDGFYEGMQVVISAGRGAGQISRIFGYTAQDQTIDVMLETDPDASSSYSITLLEGFEVGDDDFSWGVSSSTAGRSAAMHGNPATASFKAFQYQGQPLSVNRVTSAGYEMPNTFPRFLGSAIKEGDVVTAYLDLEAHTLSFTVNNDRLGDPIQGIVGPVVPAISVSSVTDCIIRIGNYRRWAPNSGWAAGEDTDYGFEEEELEQLREAFAGVQKGGSILLTELRELLTSLGWSGTDAEMTMIMDEVDIDGSGSLDQTEFLQLLAGMKEEGTWHMGMMKDVQRRKTNG